MEENINTAAEETTEPAKESKEAKKEKKCDKKELLAKIAELEAAVAERDDKYLRMAAEYDNFRRRSREEKDGVYDSALGDTVSELLPIIDNLERAELFDDADKVREGLVMIAKSAKSALEKLGVESFGAAGETFDPNLHNAVFHVEDESLGEGEIVEVFQKGYKKGKRVIRFAMVKTAN